MSDSRQRIGVVEKLMRDTFVIGAADTERDDARYILDDGPTRSAIAAKGVSIRAAMLPQPMSKPTPGNADLLLVSDNAADWLGIAEVAVGADDACHDIAHRPCSSSSAPGCLRRDRRTP